MNELASRYAQALYETGESEDSLLRLADFLSQEQLLWDVMVNPCIHAEQKQAVLSALPAFSEHPRMLRFFYLLAEMGRLPLLPEICHEYHSLHLASAHIGLCRMTCLRIPSPQQQERLKERLCKLHNKADISFVFNIDPAILGGFILEIDAVTYDQSVRGKLQSMNHYLEEVNA